MSGRRLIAVAVVLVLGGLALIWYAIGGDNAAPPRSAPGSAIASGSGGSALAGGSGSGAGLAGGPSLGGLAPATDAIQLRDDGSMFFDRGPSWPTLPATYPMTRFAVDSVAINLAGTPVTVTHPYGRNGDPPALTTIRGRVTAGGKPLAGATVVLGERLFVVFGHLSGQAAAVTGADGAFTIEAPVTAAWALALAPTGWSELTRITSAPLELVVLPAAGLAGSVSEDGKPLQADLTLVRDGFIAQVTTGVDGLFTFAALPPGPIDVSVGAVQQTEGGADEPTTATVELVPGTVVRLDVKLDSNNATVVVKPAWPAGETPSIVRHALLPDGTIPADRDQLMARVDGAISLVGGSTALADLQYHRVPRGPRIACVDGEMKSGATYFGCIRVVIDARRVIEVPLPVVRASAPAADAAP